MNAINANAVAKENRTISFVYAGWLAIALFYFYQYILRVAPGVLVTDLRQTFHLTAEQFATLGAFYLYAYSLCQIPLGIIVDYIGVRKTVIASIMLCLSGTFLLSFAPTLEVLQISRILVGIGSACAFMCSLKIVVDYLPVGKRGFLMGTTLTLGTLGAIVAGKPLASLADHVGWRPTVSYTALFGLVILLITFLFLPRPRKELLIPVSQDIVRTVSRSLIDVFKTRAIMMYSILAIGVYTPLSVLADLWGVSFIMQKYTLDRTQAAEISMMMYFGLGLGCLILPWLSEKYHFLNRSIQVCVFGVLGVFAFLLYGPVLSPLALKITLILLGIFCGVEMLCFTGASRYTHARNVGTTLGVVNTLNMLGGGVLQQLIGWVLDRLWSGRASDGGVRFYNTSEYTTALSVLLIVIIICCLMSLRLPKDSSNPAV
ncbi:putative sulfoacetate transporter SauU [Aquicella siphonis]|uniref:Putative sulfoacetate transporter SauU n=1 Tax=Aquicella siphonis TaxID=254247 RepID=A0A5E4PFL4_9COXI|nr:MFS transporter [Aquicella siphonis]VVC75415.1 putative sulfoacetate transporter SauU [Aquicella siphonis]